MNRIEVVFNKLKSNKEKALIPFIACGDPSLEKTVERVLALEKSGADIIELGVPFSDPLADGEVIQNSYCRALKNGFKVDDIFKVCKEVRKTSNIPLVIMVYYNLVFTKGVDSFLKEALRAGFDGIIVPDIPLEERGILYEKCIINNLALIPLVAPTSKDRIKKVTSQGAGFVYCVSSNGTTGERSSLRRDIVEYLNSVRESSNLPICLGFGISSCSVVNNVKEYCDGVIVGSAVVRRFNEDEESALDFVKELKKETLY